jgi:hypothetical protein
MHKGGLKKLLDGLGFGWFICTTEQFRKISLSDIRPVPLYGNFDLGFALGEYSREDKGVKAKTPVGHLLHEFKYGQNHQAGEILADLASDFIRSQSALNSADLMLTVPPSFKSRAIDPITFLAKRIEGKTQIRWEKGILARTKLSQPQKGILDRKLKKLNVLNTYKMTKPTKIEGQKILLFDDVLDSGITINEISAILREEKAQEICVLVLASIGFSVEGGSSF